VRIQKCERLRLKEPSREESAAEHITNITDITRRLVRRPVPTVKTVTHKWMAGACAPAMLATASCREAGQFADPRGPRL
jgi:hypothetical protein